MSSSSSCDLVSASFDYIPSKVNDGVDPTLNPMWACVRAQSGSTSHNTAVKLVITPGNLADCVELSVAWADTTNVGAAPWTNFSQAETPLTIYGYSAKDECTIYAKNKHTGATLDTLKIMVLPFRTLGLAIYRVTDSNSSATSPTGAPADDSLMDDLAVFERQGCVSFIKNRSESLDIHYDTNPKDGKTQAGEDQTISSYAGWQEQIRAVWVRESAIPYPGCPSLMSKGTAAPPKKLGMVWPITGGAQSGLGMAHEFGHLFDINDVIGHDTGQTPANTLALMRAGQSNCQYQDIGQWIRKDHWKIFNTSAGTF